MRHLEDDQPIPYCLACGYERAGLDLDHACPECGHDCSREADHQARSGVEASFRQPQRRATQELLGRVPLGWWCLLPGRMRLAARVQMVVSLTLTTLVLLALFLGGAHVRLRFATHPVRSANPQTPGVSAITGGGDFEPALIDNAVLGGLLRADLGGYRELGTRPLPAIVPRGEGLAGPRIEFVSPNWSPFFLAMGTWSACFPAAGLLGLRFVLFPLALRWQRRSLTPGTRAAASIAADATVASASIGCCRVIVGFALLSFALAAVLPNQTALQLVRIEPWAILALLFGLPPLLVSIVVWHDRARRVFAWPKLAAALTFASYFIGIGLAVGTIAATFAIAVRLMS